MYLFTFKAKNKGNHTLITLLLNSSTFVLSAPPPLSHQQRHVLHAHSISELIGPPQFVNIQARFNGQEVRFGLGWIAVLSLEGEENYSGEDSNAGRHVQLPASLFNQVLCALQGGRSESCVAGSSYNTQQFVLIMNGEEMNGEEIMWTARWNEK